MKLELLGFAWRGKDILLMTNKGEAKLSVGDFERLLTLAPSAKRYEASLARLAVFAILRSKEDGGRDVNRT